MDQHIVNFNVILGKLGIELSRETIENRQRGKIVKGGWTIWYLFGTDEVGQYLDHYACHRMTGDSHVRWYADGSPKALDSYLDLRLTSDDPEEDRRLDNECLEHNERVTRELEAKGFGL